MDVLMETAQLQNLSPQSLLSSFLFFLAITVSTHLIHRDYAEFKSLGPGGTPSTIPGYLRIKFLGLFALKNPYLPSATPTWPNRPAYLTKLPKREGNRPRVRGIAPHRQSDQKSTPQTFQSLRASILSLATQNPQKLRHGTSCLEKHGPGLFAQTPINRSRHCNGEVCHAHPSDGSIHLTLHPADAAIVLQQAWGERHPLSSGGWLARFVPPGFVMVYAPRDEDEIEVVMGIVKAAVWWVGGTDLEGMVEDKAGRLDIVQEEREEEVCQLPSLVRKMRD